MSLQSIAFGLTMVAIPACGASTQQKPPAPPTPLPGIELKFGVYTSDKATTMYRMFTPVLERLQEGLERNLKRPVEIELKIYKTYDGALQAFVAGEVDFVRFGPASYVLAKQRNPEVELLAIESHGGKRTFQGMIVVRQDSPIETIADLRGCSFAFGDENSTIGRYLAQDRLLEEKITARDLSHYAYLGRHDKVFSAVEVGDFDAGSVKDSTFQKMNRKDQLRVLAQFDNVTKPWVARQGLAPELKATLRGVLLGLEEAEVLASLRVDGFLEAADAHFEVTRKAMLRANSFEAPPANPGK